jgi:hypothetical protein
VAVALRSASAFRASCSVLTRASPSSNPHVFSAREVTPLSRGQLHLQVGAAHAEIYRLSTLLSQQPIRPGEGLPLLVKLNLETLLLAEELSLSPRPPLELLK